MSYYKLTENEIEKLDANDIINKLEPSVKAIIEEKIDRLKLDLIFELQNSESPIERIMLLKLNELIYGNRLYNKGFDVLGIDCQETVNCGGKEYRCDIVIPVLRMSDKLLKLFVVECDGHEFHNKTKDQVKKDNERNRELTKHGYTVIHFSGSEIVKDSKKCAKDVLDIILDSFK